MAGDITETGELYSPAVGLIYVFNLIVGTGALTMPKAFAIAGWLLSVIFIALLAFMSYLSVTFVVEAMAAANAVLQLKKDGKLKQDDKDREKQSEKTPLITHSEKEGKAIADGVGGGPVVEAGHADQSVFDISQRIEMGQMASMFFNKAGVIAYYICMAVYLYGDLAIYAASVPKSMRDVACTFQPNDSSQCGLNISDSVPCWPGVESVNRDDAYRIFLAAFTLCLGPFVFFSVQKTKYLQIFTTLMRWLAFSMMIVLAIIRLAKGEGQGRPPVANFDGVPNLFGVCVYSFMCHHSLPSLVTPMKKKDKVYPLFAADYLLVLGFYALLAFTGIFAFQELDDLYTLNFKPDNCKGETEPITNIAFIQYFLALFPVFTLSTNFPIIGVTLRNNLKTLFHRERKEYHWFVDRVVFPLITLIPPIAVAFATHNIQTLVGITGSYGGAAIQYFIPAALVFYGRRSLSSQKVEPNKFKSPFGHVAWVFLVLIWAAICVIVVSINHIITGK